MLGGSGAILDYELRLFCVNIFVQKKNCGTAALKRGGFSFARVWSNVEGGTAPRCMSFWWEHWHCVVKHRWNTLDLLQSTLQCLHQCAPSCHTGFDKLYNPWFHASYSCKFASARQSVSSADASLTLKFAAGVVLPLYVINWYVLHRCGIAI